jgi:hypothetical protein
MKYILIFLSIVFTATLSAQITKTLGGDSTNLPRIKITADPSSFGPYYINTNHTNVYFVTEFPESTSMVVMKYIDSKGELLGEPKIQEGSNIEVVEWTVNAQDVGFVLSPCLNIEVHYKTDSIAVYNIPYTVYPDTVFVNASAGWGPFISNKYTLTDGYQPVNETPNTFSASNLPPRTNTIEFQIISNDSTVIDSLWVYAEEGQYLDSAAFSNVRMDSLPLSARTLTTLIWCEGGPDAGLSYKNKIDIIQQKATLTTRSEGETLTDSIPPFVINQYIGQALLIDSTKNIEITNGPADTYNLVGYKGPYCFDMFSGYSNFSIETWLKFDLEKIHNASGYGEGMNIMKVDSVWGLDFFTYGSHFYITLRSDIVSINNEIFHVDLPFESLAGNEWHHVALTYYSDNNSTPEVHIYLDGQNCDNATFHKDNYLKMKLNYFKIWSIMKTQPLIIGQTQSTPDDGSFITGVDEVRLWQKTLTANQIKQNYHKKVLQDPDLVGYFNFDDLRNRLGYASDISYKNNRGLLKNGATFIPQHPTIQLTLDTLIVKSSNKNTDSVTYSFINADNYTVTSVTKPAQNGYDTLLFDFSSLPVNVKRLLVQEYSDDTPDKPDSIYYNLQGLAPIPIATPRYNWQAFNSDKNPDMGELFNSIVVSGLPENTTKVTLELKNDENTILSEDYHENNIPYRYSLELNGTNNYVETSQMVTAPGKYTLSLWFKTTTSEGGEIIGLKKATKLLNRSKQDRKLVIRKDGSLRYYITNTNSTYILSAVNRYNDGNWHQVTVSVENGAKLYVDGSLVDYNEEAANDENSGYWIMGLSEDSKKHTPEEEQISKYFKGSLSEVVITESASDYHWINTNLYGLKNNRAAKLYFKFNDGKGSTVKEYASGNNAIIKGTSLMWFTSNKISYVVWNHDVLNEFPGTYNFTATVYYNGGPKSGTAYQLGRIQLTKPFTFLDFEYKMKNGFGYFNEGTTLPNSFDFVTKNVSGKHAVFCKLLTLDHTLVAQKEFVFENGNGSGSLPFDMGEMTPGSFISIQVNNGSNEGQFAVPLFINPLIKPIVQCDLGPFTQSIAPGTMVQNKKITVLTEILSDLKRINAVFYDINNFAIDNVDLTQENDTTWNFTYDMAELSPPVTNLKLYYYMGENPNPVLIQGPYPITIHKTRPNWFDFVPDKDFSNINQIGNTVTFSVKTPLTHTGYKNHNMYGKINMSVIYPEDIQLIGGAIAGMHANIIGAKLAFDTKSFKLKLNQKPDFFQNTYVFGAGNAKLIEGNFESNQDDSYELDSDNNLIVSQNFDAGGSLNTFIIEDINVFKKIEDIINLAGSVSPGSEIIKPSFNIRAYGSFKYSSRIHMKTDTLKGGWGSYGNLEIESNPDEAGYKESASYNFYAGAIGIEFDIGAELLEGLVGGYFGLSSQVGMGYGHSYVTIPAYTDSILKSGVIQVYGRFYVESLKGWYSTTVWGPELFYSYTFWGDDLSHCFPDGAKKTTETIPSNSSWPALTDEIIPVHNFNKMPMPVARPRIVSTNNLNLFSWIEEGSSFGERKLLSRFYDKKKRTFSNKLLIELNNNALNSPVADGIKNNLSFYTWAESRYNSTTIQEVSAENILSEFARSQDIWYAVYDHEKDSLLIKEPLADDIRNNTSGRSEANPSLTVLSDSRVLITWQVADLDNHTSAIWYNLIERTGNQWKAEAPQILININGIATNLQIASPGEENALVTWLETEKGTGENKIMSIQYNGNSWSESVVLADQQETYFNYLSLNFKNNHGGLVYTLFAKDSTKNPYEKLMLLPWNSENNQWMIASPVELMRDSVNHLQFPAMAIYDDGLAAIAIKIEEMVSKTAVTRISQIDLFMGDLNNPMTEWNHITANSYVCDTTKQVNDFNITFAGKDTLMILSNEFPMLPTNSAFTPVNGITFGNPYMNLVLRGFKIDESGKIQDIDEHKYFTDIHEVKQPKVKLQLYQNYPNPCDENTTLTFDITIPDRAKLELFDINGNRIATLADRHFNIGRYNITLNTLLLKSGIYIYRLTTNNQSNSLRMIVKH